MIAPPLPVLLVGGLLAMLGVRAVLQTLALHKASRADQRREHDMERVASYELGCSEGAARLPERTWTDLDMDAVFQHLARTVGWPGHHALYARLRREDHSFEALRQFDQAVTRVASDDALRRTLRAALEPLDHSQASALPALFQGDLFSAPPFAVIYPVLTVVALALLVGTFFQPQLLLPLVGLVLVNVYVRMLLRERMERALPAMRALPSLLRASAVLGALDAPELATQTFALRAATPRLRPIARAARWVSFESFGANELANMLYEYVNLLFLLDVTTYAWSIAAIRAERSTIQRVYEALGALDVMQSVATLRGEAMQWARPVFRAGAERTLAFAALVHPLLEKPVPNSLEMSGRSVLLTGSNMSGKSTFIRTIGVNAVLARTLHMVFGAEWRAPRWAVRTSIGRADSLLEGKSYYRAEVDAVRALFDGVAGEQQLVLIDELFRGTNSIERIAAAKAVLAELDRGGDLVIVATHDVELLEMLPSYVSYHFREEVRDGQLTFDYQLHDGASSTRNALAILALAGYPDGVVREAIEAAGELEGRVRG